MTEEQTAKVRRALSLVLVALVALCAGLAAGRFTAPLKTETKIEFRELAVEDITRGFTFARTVEVTRWRNVTTTITDAGTVVVDRTVEREGSSTAGTETETSKRTSDSTGSSVVTVTARPSWRISAQVGASLVTPKLPIAGPLVVGASVEARLAQTPFSVGLWGNTVGAGGVVLSGEF